MHEFLQGTDWENAEISPIAGDASARRYARLSFPSAILMIDPEGDTQKFADIAAILHAANLCAPQIHAHDVTHGTMIISDLGPTDFANHLVQYPSEERALYQATTDILARLHHIPGQPNLSLMTHEKAAEMIDLASLHYAETPDGKDALHEAILSAYEKHVDPELRLCLRDFHAENLIWRPTLSGTDRIGLLDFQDACMAPIGYDLMSFIRDARRDVDENVAQAVTTQFCNLVGINAQAINAHLACVGAQRNLRILGIFARLAKSGKPQYLRFIPRVWRHLLTDLSHPALINLKSVALSHLPEPNPQTLSRLEHT